jgi:hypothetical protein
MKIKRFNENIEEGRKFYIFEVHPNDQKYRGSIWDNTQKKWIPNRAKLIGKFNIKDNRQYMIVSQEELDEINKIKDDRKREQDAKKFNL